MTLKRHRYVAFYPNDWIGGTAHLTPMQRLVYHDICVHCWDHASECPVTKLATILRDIPDWRDVVDQLVSLGKIYRTETGDVGNFRAIKEAKKSARIYSQKSKGGKNRHKKTNAKKHLLPVRSPEGVLQDSSRTQPENRPEQNLYTSLVSLGAARGKKRLGNGRVTVPDPDERLHRFQKALAEAMGEHGWQIVTAATDDTNPDHRAALAACKQVAHELGKGWPTNWPTQERYAP